MAAPTTVDEYMAALPPERRAAVEHLRQTVRAAAPEATETISYLMPAFRTHGQFLVSFAAFKNHYSLFPASEAVIEALGEALTPYLAGKGTIRFPADTPIPTAIVTKIVKVRLAENEARAASEEVGERPRIPARTHPSEV
ncbi:MAG: DUF1801 domain-containing protein [Actinobacteria bacterium]|nr:DUF1801 domain-containing protein [Actinomycetota bacterium]